jgi:hypothetical protein
MCLVLPPPPRLMLPPRFARVSGTRQLTCGKHSQRAVHLHASELGGVAAGNLLNAERDELSLELLELLDELVALLVLELAGADLELRRRHLLRHGGEVQRVARVEGEGGFGATKRAHTSQFSRLSSSQGQAGRSGAEKRRAWLARLVRVDSRRAVQRPGRGWPTGTRRTRRRVQSSRRLAALLPFRVSLPLLKLPHLTCRIMLSWLKGNASSPKVQQLWGTHLSLSPSPSPNNLDSPSRATCNLQSSPSRRVIEAHTLYTAYRVTDAQDRGHPRAAEAHASMSPLTPRKGSNMTGNG